MRFRLVRTASFRCFTAVVAATLVAGCGAVPPTGPTVSENGAGGGDAKKTDVFVPFTGPLSLASDRWDRLVEGNPPRLRNDGGFLVAPIPVNDRVKPSLNYIFSPGNRSITGASGIDIDLEIVTTGSPVFHHDGGEGGMPPSLRAFFWSYDLKDDRTASARWWSRVGLELTPGPTTLHLDFDPKMWSNVNGQFGEDVPAEFAAARGNTVALGLTFGGGFFFGHGVSVSGGTADVVVKSYRVY